MFLLLLPPLLMLLLLVLSYTMGFVPLKNLLVVLLFFFVVRVPSSHHISNLGTREKMLPSLLSKSLTPKCIQISRDIFLEKTSVSMVIE